MFTNNPSIFAKVIKNLPFSQMQKTHVSFQHKTLKFKKPATTSRDTLKTKDTYYFELWNECCPDITGIGECSPIWGLSPETKEELEETLEKVIESPDYYLTNLNLLDNFPTVRFGLEMAQKDWAEGGKRILFPSDFTDKKTPIPINGLIWMGSLEEMETQIEEKLASGFDCIKLKIGSLDFEKEFDLIASIREKYSSEIIEIRVDANGAFSGRNPLEKLERLATLSLHSIEQPIRQGNWKEMKDLCKVTPLPIALDEELIGVTKLEDKRNLLVTIRPQYIILKPSLLGGFHHCDEWIALAEELNIGWWATSALESNIGLNAIAQWVFMKRNSMYQGLGTGKLYNNNIKSPLEIIAGALVYNKGDLWGNI